MSIGALTVFDVGSTSKQFTAASVPTLAQEGRLAVGDDVRTFIPQLPDHRTPITSRDLLHHASGIRHYDMRSPQPPRTALRHTGSRAGPGSATHDVQRSEGNYQSHIEDLKRRNGPDADQPHRVAYKKLVRA